MVISARLLARNGHPLRSAFRAACLSCLLVLVVACSTGDAHHSSDKPATARACSEAVPFRSGQSLSIELGRQLGPFTVAVGTRVTVYASTTHPIFFRPARLGCVFSTGLDSATGKRVAQFVILRPGTATIWNVIRQGPYPGSEVASQGATLHVT